MDTLIWAWLQVLEGVCLLLLVLLIEAGRSLRQLLKSFPRLAEFLSEVLDFLCDWVDYFRLSVRRSRRKREKKIKKSSNTLPL